MGKNIWIFHHYATGPERSGLTRPYNFGVILKKYGYNVTVFSASYLHFSNEQLINDNRLFYTEVSDGIPFIFVKTPSYQNNGLSRIRNLLSFLLNLNRVCAKFSSPDIICASSPDLFTLVAGIYISGKKKVPCICEIRDLWPEAVFWVGKVKEKGILGRLLIGMEHWIYKKADALVFTKEGDTDYLKERKWLKDQGGDIDIRKCHYINNGVNIRRYYQQMEMMKVNDDDLNKDLFKVVYAGAVRTVNHLETVVECAEILKDHTDVLFLIYGDGDRLEYLKALKDEKKLDNIEFKGYVNKQYIPYILSKASVNILNYSQNLYNWSRGNSSNKLFEYMASGKPIISTVKMGYSLIEKYHCGISLESPSPDCMADAILKIKDMPTGAYFAMGDNGKKGAEDFDFELLAKKFINMIDEVLEMNSNNNSVYSK